MELIVILTVLLIVVGTPATLLWWHLANKWARGEHGQPPSSSQSPGQIATGPPRPPGAGPAPSRPGDRPTVIRVARPEGERPPERDTPDHSDQPNQEPRA